jgi:hypothetical protein
MTEILNHSGRESCHTERCLREYSVLAWAAVHRAHHLCESTEGGWRSDCDDAALCGSNNGADTIQLQFPLNRNLKLLRDGTHGSMATQNGTDLVLRHGSERRPGRKFGRLCVCDPLTLRLSAGFLDRDRVEVCSCDCVYLCSPALLVESTPVCKDIYTLVWILMTIVCCGAQVHRDVGWLVWYYLISHHSGYGRPDGRWSCVLLLPHVWRYDPKTSRHLPCELHQSFPLCRMFVEYP